MQGTDKPPAQDSGRGKQEVGSRKRKPRSNNVVDYYFEHFMLTAADIINEAPDPTKVLRGDPVQVHRGVTKCKGLGKRSGETSGQRRWSPHQHQQRHLATPG